MNIKVTKRSGKVVELELEKWQAQVAKVCEGVSDVSQSMIEITSQPHFLMVLQLEILMGLLYGLSLILLMSSKTLKLGTRTINM